MRTLRLPIASARERGLAHGRALRNEIRALAALRSDLCRTQGFFRSDDELVAVAERHLPILRAFDRELLDELLGIADGADLTPARIVILNHYTDLKDLDPRGLGDDECSAIVAATDQGPLLGQTWDMHGSAEPFVTMLHVPAEGDRPAAWLLSLAGCLGMAGMNSAGLGVTINNLKSLDAHIGLVWPALVRRLLRERRAEDARDVVLTAPLGSGHHYLVADAGRAFGIETSGRLAEVWRDLRLDAPPAGFHHENHCLGSKVAEASTISPVSTTRERFAWLEASLGARPVADREDLWARLGSHDGHPRGICTHLAGPEAPHAMKTCAGIVMDLRAPRAWAAHGCLHGAVPEELSFEG